MTGAIDPFAALEDALQEVRHYNAEKMLEDDLREIARKTFMPRADDPFDPSPFTPRDEAELIAYFHYELRRDGIEPA